MGGSASTTKNNSTETDDTIQMNSSTISIMPNSTSAVTPKETAATNTSIAVVPPSSTVAPKETPTKPSKPNESIAITSFDTKTLTAAWENIPNACTSDYITIADVTSPSEEYITYGYNTNGRASASVAISCDGYLDKENTYEIRYVSVTGEVVTTSNTTFNIHTATALQPTETPSIVTEATTKTPTPPPPAPPQGVVTYDGDKVLPPTVIAWVDSMPTIQTKIEQSHTFLTGCVETQIEAYQQAVDNGSDTQRPDLLQVLQQKADILLYIAELEKQPKEPVQQTSSVSPCIASQAQATANVVATILLYKPKTPFDASLLERLHAIVQLCLSPLAPTKLQTLLQADDHNIATHVNNVIETSNDVGINGEKEQHQTLKKVRDDLGGEGGYISIGLKMGCGYMNWEISNARTTNMFLDIIEESLVQEEDVSDTANEWRERSSAVLLLCAHLTSYSLTQPKSPTFCDLKQLVTRHMERITDELQLHEDLMRTSGELGMLGGLSVDQNKSGSDRIRQNDDTILGTHPMYLKFKKAYNQEETLVYNFPWFLNLPKAMFKEYPMDIQEMVEYLTQASAVTLQWDASFDKSEQLCTVIVQPYVSWECGGVDVWRCGGVDVVLWCCGVVVLWCCGVWCCGVVVCDVVVCGVCVHWQFICVCCRFFF